MGGWEPLLGGWEPQWVVGNSLPYNVWLPTISSSAVPRLFLYVHIHPLYGMDQPLKLPESDVRVQIVLICFDNLFMISSVNMSS